MKSKIFFIVGVQRSGTTLLQSLLSKHPGISMEERAIAFRIITCFNNLYDLLPFNVAHNKEAFLKWLIENDEKGRLAALIDTQNLADYQTIQELIQQSIYKKIAEEETIIWGDKSPNAQHYIKDLKLFIPEAKFLHIIRDGRANAYSMSKRSYQNLRLSAQHWVDGNIFGLVNQDILGMDNYKILRYEDLLTNPEKELKEVCDFLEIPFNKKMLDLSNNTLQEEKQYVKSYFDTSKINAWQEQLSKKSIEQVETIQGPLLKKSGYELVTNPAFFKILSLRKKIYINQIDNIKHLFRRKKMGMKGQEIVELELSFKNRLYTYLTVLARDFLPLPIVKALFSRYFYKDKYFKGKEK